MIYNASKIPLAKILDLVIQTGPNYLSADYNSCSPAIVLFRHGPDTCTMFKYEQAEVFKYIIIILRLLYTLIYRVKKYYRQCVSILSPRTVPACWATHITTAGWCGVGSIILVSYISFPAVPTFLSLVSLYLSIITTKKQVNACARQWIRVHTDSPTNS